MSGTARVAAQAKVNLTLRVLEREASGYHQIETVFQRLALADVVTVRAADGRSLDTRWTGPGVAPDLGSVERNLAWRAADAYARATGWPGGFAIEVEKSIPVGGGLGGGSADAAAVLRGLDALAPRPVGPAALVDIGSRLGADVAFLTSPSELASPGDAASACSTCRRFRKLGARSFPILASAPRRHTTPWPGTAYGCRWSPRPHGDLLVRWAAGSPWQPMR